MSIRHFREGGEEEGQAGEEEEGGGGEEGEEAEARPHVGHRQGPARGQR